MPTLNEIERTLKSLQERGIVYQTSTYNYTPRKVADEFARTYFGEPRKVESMSADGKFKLVDGNATYQVKTVKGQYAGQDTFQVDKLN